MKESKDKDFKDLIELCGACPKISSCIKYCRKAQSLADDSSAKEIPVSQLTRKSPKKPDEDQPPLSIDDFRHLDEEQRAKSADVAEVREHQPADSSEGLTKKDETIIPSLFDPLSILETRGMLLDPNQYKFFKKCVIRAIPRQKKLTRRFFAFMRCAKIVEIALSAGVKKQSIQKQFARVISQTLEIMAKDKLQTLPKKMKMTPRKFKNLLLTQKGITF